MVSVASEPWIEMRSLLSHSESNDRLGLGTSSVAAWFAHASCETAHLMPSKKVRFSMASVWTFLPKAPKHSRGKLFPFKGNLNE